jgi:hypothetical protein
MVLDDNQRVLAALQPGTRPLAEQALDILAHHPREEGYEIREVAPVQIVPNVLAPGLCQRLIKLWQSGGHEEGLVYRVDSGRNVHSVDFEQKRRLDHVIRDKSMIDLLSRLIGPRVADEAFKAHYFRDFRFEQFVIGAYDAERQDFFRRHRDNLGGKTAQRRFAISINLNDDFDGGGVMFPEFGAHRYRPPAGGALIFSCLFAHEAVPVTRGRRFVLLTFLVDPQGRPHPWCVRTD